MEYLTVKDVAELKGCSVQYIKKLALEGKLTANKELNPQNNCMQYLFPVTALPEDLKSKYYSKLKNEAQLCLPKAEPVAIKAEKPKREFGDFNADEREQITFWTETIREWRVRRKEYESLAEGDMCFIAEVKRLNKEKLEKYGITISKDILYRKYKAYKENRLDGLCENRGGWNKDINHIPQILLECFNSFYLDDRELPVSKCYKLTKEWAYEEYPELLTDVPSERSFRRQAEKLPIAVVKYFRHSKKECLDECLPFIQRLYDGIEANDVWVADNHTFDFVTKTNDGEKNHRLYITGILDAKTGALVGWNITENPSSYSTVLALRHAIQRCGIPDKLYVDNGT